MYGSPAAAAAKDLNLPFLAATAGFGHRREESDLQRQQQLMSSSLLRYRSAPSAVLGEVCEDFLPVRPSSPETDSMLARFLASDLRDDKATGGGLRNPVCMPAPVEQSGGFSSASSQMLFHSHQQHQPPPSPLENAYRGVTATVMESEQMKSGAAAGGGGGGGNLIRQSSSPAGFFSHLNVDCGYGLMRAGMAATSIRNGMVAETAVGRLKGQISFSSRQNSLSQISEMGSDDISGGGGSPDESSNGHCVVPGYAVSAWESSLLSDSFSVAGACGGGLKRTASDIVGLNQTGLRNGELRSHRAAGFPHQISLPKCPEFPVLDKLLHFHDSVPCKIRAKRGCATHPRSIAERVRRTRISERMRKLQELVPNMDKQTNTADMLDLAVDYIKDLQRQVKSLSDSRRSCICSSSNERHYESKAS